MAIKPSKEVEAAEKIKQINFLHQTFIDDHSQLTNRISEIIQETVVAPLQARITELEAENKKLRSKQREKQIEDHLNNLTNQGCY